MAVTVTPDKTAYAYLDTISLAVAGAANNTDYIVSINDPDGHVTQIQVTTNGSGSATAKAVQQSARGAISVSVRPAAEHNGKTTAAASASTKGA